MEEYPEELRTPPVALACVVGFPELHGHITAHLHSQQPPINAFALPHFSNIAIICAPSPKRTPTTQLVFWKGIGFPSIGLGFPLLFPRYLPPMTSPVIRLGGFMSATISKISSTRRLVIIFIRTISVFAIKPISYIFATPPIQFYARATIRGRNIRLVVVVVAQSGHEVDTSEDRMITLRTRAEVDAKNLIVFVPDDQLELQ